MTPGDAGAAPRITVVTPSFNQGAFIGRTIRSVLDQDYPNLEHIVVDGMSTDQTQQVLDQFSHLRVLREPDKGQAHAINKGFDLATGEIYCFLNSDDTLLPGALERVAKDIDPSGNRHVVMGRCLFIDEQDVFSGIEHASAFEGHERVLQVWKGHCIPQPAVFWTREVWERCGPLDENEQLVLDYDLFCRFSEHYEFHPIETALATYRLHGGSKTRLTNRNEVISRAIAVSRRYWGPPTKFKFWRLQMSLAAYRFDRRHRAHRLFLKGQDLRHESRWLYSLGCLLPALLLAPDIAVRYIAPPALYKGFDGLNPLTAAYRNFTGLHPDGWAGPTFVENITTETDQGRCLIASSGGGFRQLCKLDFDCFIDGVPVDNFRREYGRKFSIEIPLAGLDRGTHELKVGASGFVVSNDYLGNRDFRPICFKVLSIHID